MSVRVKDASGAEIQVDSEDVGGGVQAIRHRFAAPTSWKGKNRIASTGAASTVQGGSQAATQGVWVKALLGNASACYVGEDSGVTDSNGFELNPGEEVFIPIDNLNQIFVHFLGASPDAVCTAVA